MCIRAKKTCDGSACSPLSWAIFRHSASATGIKRQVPREPADFSYYMRPRARSQREREKREKESETRWCLSPDDIYTHGLVNFYLPYIYMYVELCAHGLRILAIMTTRYTLQARKLQRKNNKKQRRDVKSLFKSRYPEMANTSVTKRILYTFILSIQATAVS